MGMIFSGILTIDEAYQVVSWRNVFLLAGLMPLGMGLESTGAGVWAVDQFSHLINHWPVSWILVAVGGARTLAGLMLSNIGATVLLVPLVVALSESIGADPRLFALMVAIAASNAFILPTNQANALIAGPGRYQTWDFVKAGLPLTIAYLGIISFLLPLMYGP